MVDCDATRAILQRFLAGAPTADEELEQALAHAASCDECHAEFDEVMTAACTEVEDELLEAESVDTLAARLGGTMPLLADHLASCARCQAVITDLASRRTEPELETSEMPEAPVDPDALFERAFTALLTAPEPVVRQRAAAGLARLRRVGEEGAGSAAAPTAPKKPRPEKEQALRDIVAAEFDTDADATSPERALEAELAADEDDEEPGPS
jgi:predicted anti-sigma-YlaC factor YlaD